MATTRLPGFKIVETIMPDQLPAQLDIVTPIPVLEVKWADERQWCPLVHDYLDGRIDGAPAQYTACADYRDGHCGRNDAKSPCLFREPDTAEAWAKARSWARAVDANGEVFLAPRTLIIAMQADGEPVTLTADLRRASPHEAE